MKHCLNINRIASLPRLSLSALGVLMGVMVVAPAVSAQAVTVRPVRRSWVSDRQQLKQGDIVTVVIDESMSNTESTSKIADSDRSQSLGLSWNSADFTPPLTAGSFGSSNDASMRNIGQASRRQNLTAVFTVSIVGIEPTGLLRIQGQRTVETDGRAQAWTLEGLVRPEDVSSSNTIFSHRIADAQITYKGKEITPSKSILGKILSILWP